MKTPNGKKGVNGTGGALKRFENESRETACVGGKKKNDRGINTTDYSGRFAPPGGKKRCRKKSTPRDLPINRV